MYILFAILIAAIVYGLLAAVLRLARRPTRRGWRLALGSVLVLTTALVVFNFASRAVGVDLGPTRAVSYDIPEDYLAVGIIGLLALIPYALACLSPAICYALLQTRQQTA